MKVKNSSANIQCRETLGKLEQKLVRIWQDVLQVNQIGIRDNFFNLGGDSFKAFNVLAELGGGLTIDQVYHHPTIHELARYIEAESSVSE